MTPYSLLLSSDARLADLGTLLVFRHWLRCHLQTMAGLQDDELYPLRPVQVSFDSQQPISRLFF